MIAKVQLASKREKDIKYTYVIIIVTKHETCIEPKRVPRNNSMLDIIRFFIKMGKTSNVHT